MTDREFTLNYQAELIIEEFLRYKYLENQKKCFFFMPHLKYATYDTNGNTIIDKAVISNHPSGKPDEDKIIPGFNKVNRLFDDKYYREIISLHLPLGGAEPEFHGPSIVYVKEEAQNLLCEIIKRKLFEIQIINVKVYFERAMGRGVIFKKYLGYNYLCINYGF